MASSFFACPETDKLVPPPVGAGMKAIFGPICAWAGVAVGAGVGLGILVGASLGATGAGAGAAATTWTACTGDGAALGAGEGIRMLGIATLGPPASAAGIATGPVGIPTEILVAVAVAAAEVFEFSRSWINPFVASVLSFPQLGQ